ncbi:MAG: hypothetical protein IPI90_15675 [Saprospiraceae bacterium]|nr:hypothetical protein [Candidatus Vicinibacter affinis]
MSFVVLPSTCSLDEKTRIGGLLLKALKKLWGAELVRDMCIYSADECDGSLASQMRRSW